MGVVRRLGLLQIDSVNILVRAHCMPLFSRLGPYDVGLIARLAHRAPRRLVETWAHEASYVTPEVYGLMAWRRAEADRYAWGSMKTAGRERPDAVRAVYDLCAADGPLTARQAQAALEGERSRPRPKAWGWNWGLTKSALEYLFFLGALGSAGRNAQFERLYDLAERVVPGALPGRCGPGAVPAAPKDAVPLGYDRPAAMRELVEMAARACGVASERCLRDYFRLPAADARRAVGELADSGALVPVDIEGWPAWLHAGARVPRSVEARALLVPFDPMVFERNRLERLFGMRFRLEYYLPPERREYGYYVLPFLLGEQMAARVDLKADRENSTLLVRGAFPEPKADAVRTVGELALELGEMAGWLGLDSVLVEPGARGGLAGGLGRVLG
ncbi:MAG: winged helix DNA-binding domain-containing protein [Bifidobacteriaceae bacterium]|jgi:uncharacterized protein YcaQ|nr:winged helix DNA-binding domain-containing protein [Bifidobacteriaceae bacterium]